MLHYQAESKKKKKNITAQKPSTPDKERKNVGKPSVEWVKVRWAVRQRETGGGGMGKVFHPEGWRGSTRWVVCTGREGEDPLAKYLRCSGTEGLHWGNKTEPEWAIGQRRAPTQLCLISSRSFTEPDFRTPEKHTFYIVWKFRAFVKRNGKIHLRPSGTGGHTAPVSRDMGPESQEEKSKTCKGWVLRWGALF